MNQIKLDLGKKKVLDLKKELNISDVKAQVVLALDFSGSMGHLYRDGTVQSVLERLLPIALGFDDNGAIDFYLFEDGYVKVGEINTNNIDGMAERVMKQYSMGGTNYSPVINGIVRDFGTRLPADLPTYVIMISDGDNGDHGATKTSLIKASEQPIFFQTVGIGNTSFSFLEKMDTMSGRKVDNAGFFKIRDINQVSDDELYKLLLTEFPSFLAEVKKLGMLK